MKFHSEKLDDTLCLCIFRVNKIMKHMKTKIFLSIASFFACGQCIRPMFYDEPNYQLWWLAAVFFFIGFGFWVNRKTVL